MSLSDFTDSALVIFGHGTTLNSESGAAVIQHACALRGRGIFAEVREAFWKQEPRLQLVVRELRQSRVFFVPMFISEGYFSEQVIPAALGFPVENGRLTSRILRQPNQDWYYCRPPGTHDSMTAVLLDRARAIVRQFPFPVEPRPAETTLFIAGHGTGQNANSRVAVERQAELIRGMNLYAAVHAVYMEEEPRIPACYSLAQTRNLVVVPFFMGEGLHVCEDIPVLLGEPQDLVQRRLKAGKRPWVNPSEKCRKLVWYSASVGADALLAEVILERVREIVGSVGNHTIVRASAKAEPAVRQN